MVAIENDLIYIVLPGDPLGNFATALHFFGDDFKVHDDKVLVQVGQIFDVHLKLHEGVYQTYRYFESKCKFIQWESLAVSRSGSVYILKTSEELWCTKDPSMEHAYFPDENSKIFFEKYYGIR